MSLLLLLGAFVFGNDALRAANYGIQRLDDRGFVRERQRRGGSEGKRFAQCLEVEWLSHYRLACGAGPAIRAIQRSMHTSLRRMKPGLQFHPVPEWSVC